MTVHHIIKEDIQEITNRLKENASQLEGKTLLITGGAGFLGNYLVRTMSNLNKEVLKTPCKVIVLDNFITGLRDSFENDANITLIEHDITKPINLPGNIDYILHAASIASPLFYNKYRIETIDVGFLGTKYMLELAKEKNAKSFVFFSSSEIYGDPDPQYVPTPETYFGNVSSIGPRACYDEPKRIGETLCVTYKEIHKVPAKIIRIFNVYGPGIRLDDRRVVPNFVVAGLKGFEIPIHGEGKHTRAFCYINDVIIGIFSALFSPHNGEAFNLGNDTQEVSVEGLAQVTAEVFKNSFNIDAKVSKVISSLDVYSKADPKRRCPDLRKSQTLLNYNPQIDLRDGLRRVIAWAKDQKIDHIDIKHTL
jgi:nucleoside-diphosphate-sugar epimerase